MPNLVCELRQFHPFEFAPPFRIKETEFDFSRMRREEREVDAEAVPSCAQWERASLTNAGR
jgi:hypothetical protein